MLFLQLTDWPEIIEMILLSEAIRIAIEDGTPDDAVEMVEEMKSYLLSFIVGEN
jgi:hypothetical protein